jgi:hypothetical protein
MSSTPTTQVRVTVGRESKDCTTVQSGSDDRGKYFICGIGKFHKDSQCKYFICGIGKFHKDSQCKYFICGIGKFHKDSQCKYFICGIGKFHRFAVKIFHLWDREIPQRFAV